MKTLVIVPAWNEAEALGPTLAEITQANPTVDVLVVDDGSTDATAEIAQSAGALVLKLPFNLGVGGAMRAGYEFAKRYGYDQAIQVDADGQHDASEIAAVLSGLATADICLGARFAGKGQYSAAGPRRWAMAMLAAIVSRMAHTKLTDITSGFRSANRKAIAQYCRHYPAEYLGDTVDSLVMAIRSGCTVTQVPVEMLARRAGQASHDPFKSTILLGRTMFALLVALTRRRVTVRDGD